MISWEDVYRVVVAMTPLYVALMLGYGSVKWWKIFSSDQCDTINRFVYYFTLPLFIFEFTVSVNPYEMNFRFIAADAISKIITVLVIALWARFSSKGSYSWSITSYSLCTLTNTLVVGVPLMEAMYGQLAVDLVVQEQVLQGLIWNTILLFVLEFRRVNDVPNPASSIADIEAADDSSSGTSVWGLMKRVLIKLLMNPNVFACILALVWSLLANRWHFQMPSIMNGSILIMSKAGTGTAMFIMGIFMALQENLIACGVKKTIFGMLLRFVAAPIAMAIGCLAVGLHGSVFRIAIILSALPQSITSFIFAKEYGLHADVLSTAVIFGMMACLPVLIGFYAVLELL